MADLPPGRAVRTRPRRSTQVSSRRSGVAAASTAPGRATAPGPHGPGRTGGRTSTEPRCTAVRPVSRVYADRMPFALDGRIDGVHVAYL